MDGADDLEQLEELYYSDSHQASRIGTILNLANGMCGVGVLAVPLLVQMMSLPLSLVLIVALHLTTGFTARLTVALAEKSGARSLESIAQRAYGPRGYVAASVLQLAFAIGSMVINVMACRECLVPLVRRAGLLARDDDDLSPPPPPPPAANASACLTAHARAAGASHPQSLWFHDPDTREQRVALLIVLAVALPACLRRRLPGLVLTTAVSLLCLAAIFGVVLAEWLSEARDLGSPWHNVRRGVDCATDEPMLTIRAATAFMFT